MAMHFFSLMNKLPAKTENQHNLTGKCQIYLHKEKMIIVLADDDARIPHFVKTALQIIDSSN